MLDRVFNAISSSSLWKKPRHFIVYILDWCFVSFASPNLWILSACASSVPSYCSVLSLRQTRTRSSSTIQSTDIHTQTSSGQSLMLLWMQDIMWLVSWNYCDRDSINERWECVLFQTSLIPIIDPNLKDGTEKSTIIHVAPDQKVLDEWVDFNFRSENCFNSAKKPTTLTSSIWTASILSFLYSWVDTSPFCDSNFHSISSTNFFSVHFANPSESLLNP